MSNYSDEMELDFKYLLTILWNRKWLIVGIFIITVVSMFFLIKTMDSVYRSSATIFVQKNDGISSLFENAMFLNENNQSVAYSRMIKSRVLLNQVIKDLQLRDEEGNLISVKDIESMVNVLPSENIIEVSAEHTDPKLAQAIVDNLISLFQESNVEMNRSSLSNARAFIEEQVIKVKDDLERAEEELLSYRKENEIIIPQEESKQLLQKLVEAESLKSMTEVELESIISSIKLTTEKIGDLDEKVISNTTISSNPLITEYKGQLTELEMKLVALETKYTANHPEVISLKNQINNIKMALNQEVEQEIRSYNESINPIHQNLYTSLIELEIQKLASQAKISGYEKIINNYNKELSNLPEKELKLLRLERVSKVSGEIYTMLITRLEEIKISESMQTSNMYVVDPPFLPEKPIKPNKKMILVVAGFFSILVGIGLAYILEYLDNTIKSAEEVERLLQLPVLGSIPDFDKVKSYEK